LGCEQIRSLFGDEPIILKLPVLENYKVSLILFAFCICLRFVNSCKTDAIRSSVVLY